MTGVFGTPWVDVAAASVFAVAGMVSLARWFVLTRGRGGAAGRRDASGVSGRGGADAWHAVMAAGMVVMTVPAVDPLPRWGWVACFCVAAGWAAVVLVRIGPIYGGATDPVAWRRTAGRAAHQFAGAVVMLLMVVLGHHAVAARDRPTVAVHQAHAATVGDASLAAVVVWALAAAFLVAAARSAVGVLMALRAGGAQGAGGRVGGGFATVGAATGRGVWGELRRALTSPVTASCRSTVLAAGMGAMTLAMWA